MSSHQECVLEPEGFMEIVHAATTRFEQGRQHDAQEFLLFLLDQIHEDLNRAEATKEPAQVCENASSEEAAKAAWHNHLRSHKSIVVDVFQGQTRSTIECLDCGAQSSTYDPAMYFSLPIPESKQPLNLADLLTEFTKVEKLDQKLPCEKCKKQTPFQKQIQVWKAPDILVVNLKRFRFNQSGGASKVTTPVDYPLKDLDISPFVGGFQRVKPLYNLFAVCVAFPSHLQLHIGNIDDGHYLAYTFNNSLKRWTFFDDDDFGILDSEQDVSDPNLRWSVQMAMSCCMFARILRAS